MKSWLDLEERFRNLALSLRYVRIDEQTGAAGEHWRIAGSAANESIRQFELLCNLAGQQITELKVCSEEILNHPDPKIRWYRLLKEVSPSYKTGISGYQTNDEGENLGWIHTGSISDIGEASANMCLQLHQTHPIKPKWYEILYRDYAIQIIIGLILLVAGAVIGTWFANS